MPEVKIIQQISILMISLLVKNHYQLMLRVFYCRKNESLSAYLFISLNVLIKHLSLLAGYSIFCNILPLRICNEKHSDFFVTIMHFYIADVNLFL